MPSCLRLIGFAGRAQAGKSTCARLVGHRHGHLRYRFADPIKAALGALIQTTYSSTWAASGTDEDAALEEILEGKLKEIPLPALGQRSARELMQSLGTEWGRGLVSETLWVDILRQRLERALALDWPVTVDDVRFPNEVDLIRELGGVVIEVRRPGEPIAAAQHASERQVLPNLSGTVNNDGTLVKLEEDLLNLLESLAS